jgi:phosphatidate phosphatase APP1
MYAHATNPWKMISLLMFSNASTRQPFPGVRAFYRALHGGRSGREQNPFFYISSSSWQMYDILQDFMDIHGLPPGPIFLRELPFTGSMSDPWRHGYKLRRVREILEWYPGIPFVLLGDSGQRDVEIYSLIVRSFPGRIPALYIRDVLPNALRRSRIAEISARVRDWGSELVLLNDTMAAARHAATRGWIPVDRLSEIERDRLETDFPERSFTGGGMTYGHAKGYSDEIVISSAHHKERRYP